MTTRSAPSRILGLREISSRYRFLLCDVWGVVHNGVTADPVAVTALAAHRAAGGVVVLVTNAPRMKPQVLGLFERLGVSPDAYDDLVTSGEAAHAWLGERPGLRILHLGPERDVSIYDGLEVSFPGEADADIVCCTGLFDDEAETPDDYRERLAAWSARGLPMLCVNPDKVVERGNRLVWCAGAIADAYEAVGGETIIVGKPHAPIYATALARFASIAGTGVDPAAILAIGDGAETDLRGANRQGLDALFVTDGIHADAFGARDKPDPALVATFLEDHGLGAKAWMPRLMW
jgi:HAD superfamily hydrolase (TIGR01459 family)